MLAFGPHCLTEHARCDKLEKAPPPILDPLSFPVAAPCTLPFGPTSTSQLAPCHKSEKAAPPVSGSHRPKGLESETGPTWVSTKAKDLCPNLTGPDGFGRVQT